MTVVCKGEIWRGNKKNQQNKLSHEENDESKTMILPADMAHKRSKENKIKQFYQSGTI